LNRIQAIVAIIIVTVIIGGLSAYYLTKLLIPSFLSKFKQYYPEATMSDLSKLKQDFPEATMSDFSMVKADYPELKIADFPTLKADFPEATIADFSMVKADFPELKIADFPTLKQDACMPFRTSSSELISALINTKASGIQLSPSVCMHACFCLT